MQHLKTYRRAIKSHLKQQFYRSVVNPKVLLFEDYKIAYVPVPKAANSSIRRALLPLLGVQSSSVKAIQEYDKFDIRPLSQCINVLSSEWLVFTATRSPYSRVASAYQNKIIERDINFPAFASMGMTKNSTFLDFLKAIDIWSKPRLNDHIIPQSLLLRHVNEFGHLQTLQVENLKDGWRNIRSQIEDRSSISLPLSLSHDNKSSSKFRWQDIYCDQSLSLVNKIYKADFLKFGYGIKVVI